MSNHLLSVSGFRLSEVGRLDIYCLNARRIWASTPQIADYTDYTDFTNFRETHHKNRSISNRVWVNVPILTMPRKRGILFTLLFNLRRGTSSIKPTLSNRKEKLKYGNTSL